MSALFIKIMAPDDNNVIDCPTRIPIDLLNERQAYINHSQTLNRLAERGGLDAGEAVAIIENRKWKRMSSQEAVNILNSHIKIYLEAGASLVIEPIVIAQPYDMKDAPRDGTEILAYHHSGNFHQVRWGEIHGWAHCWLNRWNSEYRQYDCDFVGWIPMPILDATGAGR